MALASVTRDPALGAARRLRHNRLTACLAHLARSSVLSSQSPWSRRRSGASSLMTLAIRAVASVTASSSPAGTTASTAVGKRRRVAHFLE